MTRYVSTALQALALAGAVMLEVSWLTLPVPLAMKLLVVGATVLSAASPPSGLLAFAGLAPLSTVLNTLLGFAYPPSRFLEQLAVAVSIGALVRLIGRPGRSRVGMPLALVGTIAIASALTLVPAAVAPLAADFDAVRLVLKEIVLRTSPAVAPPLVAGVLALEYGLLAWCAERCVRADHNLAARLVLMSLIAHAGAGLLDLQRIAAGALRGGSFLSTFPALLLGARVSMQTDVNAAGSLFVLAGVAGLGVVHGSLGRRLGVAVLGLFVLAGLWVTGSRVAMLSMIGAVGLGLGWMAVRSGVKARVVAGVTAAAIIAVVGLLGAVYPIGRNPTLNASVAGRLRLASAGLNMFKSAPVFGVGVTRFFETSAETVEQGQVWEGGRGRENAHNNFIQVLAEQGTVGLVALVFALVTLFAAALAAKNDQSPAVRLWLTFGLAAAMGTWLTGHPLLVPEFAFVFWLFCGVLAGTTPAPERGRGEFAALACAIVVLATVPTRASAIRDKAYLEHSAIGLSAWQHDDDQRYRVGGPAFILFLPAMGQPYKLPLKRAPGAPEPELVDLSVRGKVFERVRLTGDGWQNAILTLPSRHRLFEQVKVAVHGEANAGTATSVLVRVGKGGSP